MRKYVILSVLLILLLSASGQDLHFSQFYNTPLTTNPANTGFLPNSDYRIGAHYREQNSSLPSTYKTTSVYGDFQFLRNKFRSGWMGVGGVILQDAAGGNTLVSNKFYSSIAYHQMLGEEGLLSLGFNLGFANKRLNTETLRFGDQWNALSKDFNLPSGENLTQLNPSFGYFDIQAGLNYAYFPTQNIYLHFGISLHHLNRPREQFFQNSSTVDTRIKPRSIFFADAMIKMNDQVILSPGVYYTRQAKSAELVAGMHVNYNLSGDGDQQLIAGIYMRPGDAFIPSIGYQWRNFKFTFSYDATTSGLRNFNTSRGATEFYLQYDGLYTLMYANKQSFCPSFKN
ncbi:MAG: PorP/SprF family type IX secretion system membrane protein [Chitinophagaceae bacterium]|jgi:type IX secretion system PorP/SprF family membrane protein